MIYWYDENSGFICIYTSTLKTCGYVVFLYKNKDIMIHFLRPNVTLLLSFSGSLFIPDRDCGGGGRRIGE